MVADALVEARDVTFAYDNRPVLRGLTVSLRAGEFTGLVGPNGCGKSTLLRVLLGLLAPQGGEVALQGTPVRRLARREIARRAALVPQELWTDLAFSVREVVAMGRNPHLGRFRPETPEDLKIIRWALEVTESDVFAERSLQELSGGERQRVMIARAVAQQTPVLLLDEPTSSLDLQHQWEIMELVSGLAREGRCALAAIHDLSLAARFCGRLLLLADGKIAVDGPPRAVLTPEHLARYFKIRAKVLEDPEIQGTLVVPLATLTPQRKLEAKSEP